MRSAGEYTERRRQNIVVNSTFSRPPEHSTYVQILQGRQPIVVPTPVGTRTEASCCYSPPTYTITCDSTSGVLFLSDPQPTGPFYAVESAPGVGIVNFQFLQDSTVIGSQALILTGSPQIVNPTDGFTLVRYTFQCSPAVLLIATNTASDSLEPTLAYGFQNGSGVPITIHLVRTDDSILDFPIATGATDGPTPAYGYKSYTTS